MSDVAVTPGRRSQAVTRAFADRQRLRRAALAEMVIFLAGLASFIQFANFTVTALSLICFVLLPAILFVDFRGAEIVPVGLAALAWLGHTASCLVNGASLVAGSTLAPAAFGLYLVGLTVLVGRRVQAIATVLAGIGGGLVLFHLLWGTELTRSGGLLNLWKYGIATGVTVVTLYLLVRLGLRAAVFPVVLAGLAVFSLVENYRSHALICLLTAGLLVAERVLAPRIGRVWQYVVIAACAAVFAVVMPIAARAGLFGSALQDKIVRQDANHLPILFAGRTEMPLSITAISDKPWLGWGSAEQMTPSVYTRAVHLAIRFGFDANTPFAQYWRVPPDYTALHSIVFGSWGEGGLLALSLPVWLLGVSVLLVWRANRFGMWMPLVLYVAIQGIWDLLYSPWTYNLIPIHACIALLFAALHYLPARDSGSGGTPEPSRRSLLRLR